MGQEIENRNRQYEAEDFAILALINKHLCSTGTPEDRAYAIIRAYVELENPDEELQTEFARWRHGQNAETKESMFLTLIEQAARMAAEDGDSGEQE